MTKLHGVNAGGIVEVCRVTIANDTPNLASCAMSKSQDRFMMEYGYSNGIQMLVTYVKEGYAGTMFRALEDKGWEDDGDAPGHQAGNRAENEIRDEDKTRFVYWTDHVDTQTKLSNSGLNSGDEE